MSDINTRLTRERRFLVLLGIICLAMIGGALYMQIVLGEAPCPLCILQRYALLLIAIFAFVAAAMPGRKAVTAFEGLVVLSALGVSPPPAITPGYWPIRRIAAVSMYCNRSSTACQWPTGGLRCSRSRVSAPPHTRQCWVCPWHNGHCWPSC